MAKSVVQGAFVVEPDPRMVHFIGGLDEAGVPQPISPGGLRRQTDAWPRTPETPLGIADLLQTSRDLFVQAYFHYEFLVVAAQWSLYAVEAALRTVYGGRGSFQSLIDRAYEEGRIVAGDRDRLHAGRELRNQMTHAVERSTWSFGMSAGVVRGSHELVSQVFPSEGTAPSDR